ncbi:MAG: hypothetical protein E5X33_28340 [Mesorhizobium sp.]|uniref:hypothetical protein n=1 Tax=Mesorhizobium sp. TaxID=1871066 RepID=UPI0012292B83|nr:hypothetical protein [Mesorhizobium sp.]TIR16625.1 MAG: hypothetical protein E5X33_28340 [Mesorhizobium sp.]
MPHNDVDFIFAVAQHTTIWANMLARFEASAKTGKVRLLVEFFDGAASWSRVERIFARVDAGSILPGAHVEVGAPGTDTLKTSCPYSALAALRNDARS